MKYCMESSDKHFPIVQKWFRNANTVADLVRKKIENNNYAFTTFLIKNFSELNLINTFLVSLQIFFVTIA